MWRSCTTRRAPGGTRAAGAPKACAGPTPERVRAGRYDKRVHSEQCRVRIRSGECALVTLEDDRPTLLLRAKDGRKLLLHGPVPGPAHECHRPAPVAHASARSYSHTSTVRAAHACRSLRQHGVCRQGASAHDIIVSNKDGFESCQGQLLLEAGDRIGLLGALSEEKHCVRCEVCPACCPMLR